MKTSRLFLCAIGLLAAPCSLAGLPAEMEFVTVGDVGNPPDPLTGDQYGSVDYRYRIGKYEVTNREYVCFLNSVDPLGGNLKGLYEPAMSGVDFDSGKPFGQKYEVIQGRAEVPVGYIHNTTAFRFINWLNSGDTEIGAYDPTGSANQQHHPNAKFWLPSQNEWYKSAYYHGPNSALFGTFGTDYSLFPMGGFVANNAGPPGDANSANYDNGNPGPLPVGSYPNAASHYGTFDQGGNLHERFEGVSGGLLGGNWGSGIDHLDAKGGGLSRNILGAHPHVGFRVAGIPEFPDTDGDGIEDPYETNTGTYISPSNTGTDPANPDTDGDGIRDGQEVTQYMTNPNLADTDGDGFNDLAEIQTGNSPTDPAERPDAVIEVRTAVEFAFYSKAGARYQVEWSLDAQTWERFPEIITGDGSRITRFYSVRDVPIRFFRVRTI